MGRYQCQPADERRLSISLHRPGWPSSRRQLPCQVPWRALTLRLCEVAEQDEPALLRAYAMLGEQSRYLRFMRMLAEPTAEQLAWFTRYPRERQLALLLKTPEGEVIAHAQSVRRRCPERAEFACVVADAWQGQGLGRALLLTLALLAREQGVEEWVAEVLSENRPMLTLLRGLGLPLSCVTGGATQVVRLDLTALDPWRSATKGE
ncbi:GNAT family N-acetyltransferase [Aeromonas simiae]|uniref:GNAT family N-acetyltransferase n=1 Tax=Aeromonas simiae TaxID=218936 RepID=A0A5J6WV42_9GAMM|nr:GNAT family N-acetyltransferase [Aeromonas simiae]QFI54772.1 GNAT family N-acetyltransferase [Aeromonas simiae]